MKTKSFVAALGALIIGTSVVACSTDSSAQPVAGGSDPDISNVTLRVGDQIAGTEAVLKAAGALDDVPYDIEWSSFTSGPPQIEALNANQIDFAITGNTPPIVGGPTNTKVVQSFNNVGQGDAILVHKGSGIGTVADLKGKKVAVARGSSAHGHLILQLQKAGLSTSDVDINFVQPADGKAAFEGGQVDAWVAWDPYSAGAELGGADVLVTAQGVTGGYGFANVSDKALEDPGKEAAIEDLLIRVSQAYLWATEHPDEYAELYSRESGIDLESSKLNTRSIRVAVPLDDEVAKYQDALIDAFASADIVEDFDWSEVVDTRFQDSVSPYFGTPGEHSR